MLYRHTQAQCLYSKHSIEMAHGGTVVVIQENIVHHVMKKNMGMWNGYVLIGIDMVRRWHSVGSRLV